jgi:hypothetical protein
VVVNCRACGQKLSVREEWVGKRLSCPKCQSDFEVPPPEIDDLPELGDVEILDDDDSSGVYQVNAEDARLPDPFRQGPACGLRGALSLGKQADPASCLALHAGSCVGLAGCGETIFVLDLSEKRRRFQSKDQKAEVSCLAIAPDAKLVLSGDEKGGLLLWDLRSG